MVRVWGGGYYEDEYFYDLCDRYGLLVWQDFMFACAGYPLDDPIFVENVRAEVVANVRRLRHRACLALWCGNNEIEAAWVDWGWNTPQNADLTRAYAALFLSHAPAMGRRRRPRPRLLAQFSLLRAVPMHDPDSNRQATFTSGPCGTRNKPFSNYRETPARFVSEFGFQSLPALPTIARPSPPRPTGT